MIAIPKPLLCGGRRQKLYNSIKIDKLKLVKRLSVISPNYTLSSYNIQQNTDIMQTIRLKTSYTQFKKYFSKMNTEDRLSKKGINLIFSKIKEGDNCVFFHFVPKTIYL